jgi:uncharacterized protein YggU (UPF0235/DUF167 family)
MLADALHRPGSDVRIISGAAHREKLAGVTGDPAELIGQLRAL